MSYRPHDAYAVRVGDQFSGSVSRILTGNSVERKGSNPSSCACRREIIARQLQLPFLLTAFPTPPRNFRASLQSSWQPEFLLRCGKPFRLASWEWSTFG